MYKKMLWRKNFRKTPTEIIEKIKELKEPLVSVGCVIKVENSDIKSGVYGHLGINRSVRNAIVVPEVDIGRHSKFNRLGWEIILRDQPKVIKDFVFDAPNFGDYSNGSHTVHQTREVYQRRIIGPNFYELETKIESESGDESVISVKIANSFSKRELEDEKLLLHVANIMRENCGAFDVHDAGTDLAAHSRSICLNWEILPPGKKLDIIQWAAKGGSRDPRIIAIASDRYDLLAKFGPVKWIKGSGGLTRYFGALFEGDLAVFENIHAGNALYILKGNWLTLSKKSRIELMNGGFENVYRIVHTGEWQERLRILVEDLRK